MVAEIDKSSQNAILKNEIMNTEDQKQTMGFPDDKNEFLSLKFFQVYVMENNHQIGELLIIDKNKTYFKNLNDESKKSFKAGRNSKRLQSGAYRTVKLKTSFYEFVV